MEKENQSLIKELSKDLESLDQESLLIIKEQIAVLQYNQKVRSINAARQEQSREAEPSEEGEAQAPRGQKDNNPLNVHFQQLSNGKFFNLCIGRAKLFIDYKEIMCLLKIAQAAETPEAGAIRLYNWFKRERSDILGEGGIAQNNDPRLGLIWKELLDTFSMGE